MNRFPSYILPFSRSRLFASFVDNQIVLNLLTCWQHQTLGNRVVQELRYLKSQKGNISILQVGFIPGSLSNNIAQLISSEGKLTIVDPLSFQIERAKKKLARFQNVEFIEGIGENIPYSANTFDVIIIFFLFHEVPVDARQKILGESLRILHTDGSIIYCDFSKPSCIAGTILTAAFSLFGEKYLYSLINADVQKMFSIEKMKILSQEGYFCNTFQFLIVSL